MRETAFDAFRSKIEKRSRHEFLLDQELESIEQIQRDLRGEIERFYQDELPKIRKRLESEPIDDEIRHLWIKHLEEHMSHSFEMSQHFLGVLTIKNLEEIVSEFRKRMSQ